MTLNLPYRHVTFHGRVVIETLIGGPRSVRELYLERPLVGVEIGVWRGKNSATLLARLPLLKLYMVDLWGSAPEPWDHSPKQGPAQMEEALAETSFAENRRVVIRRASPAAAELVTEPLDFVFVDGDHRLEPCLADLRAWWPLVNPGGWMMGHDIDNPGEVGIGWGVREAVERFCVEVGGLPFSVAPYPAMVFAIRKPEVAV